MSDQEQSLDLPGLEYEIEKAFRRGDDAFIESLANAVGRIAEGIGGGGRPSPCPTGMGFTGTMVEGLMGIAAGLVRVSQSLDGIAEAIERRSA